MITSSAAAAATAGTLGLEVRLSGRICVIEHGGRRVALLLNPQSNLGLGFRRHFPRLAGPLDQATQRAADNASVSFMDSNGKAQALWDIEGCDVSFDGFMPESTPAVDVRALPDLRAVYEKVDPNAQWKAAGELLSAPDPRLLGVLARVSLDGFNIDTVPFDPFGNLLVDAQAPNGATAGNERLRRLFVPGDHTQEVHSVLRCRARFRPLDQGGPAVLCRPFGAATRHRYEFEDGLDLTLSVTNLCTCVGEDSLVEERRKTASGEIERWVLEDVEFRLYFELLQDPPSTRLRPVPFVRPGAGTPHVTECFGPAKL